MTKATLDSYADVGPPKPMPAGSGHTSIFYSVWSLFTMTLARQALSKRLIVMAALFVLPLALAILIRVNGAGWRGPTGGYEPKFAEVILIFLVIPQALVPLMALVYASGMIQDEIEEQTITYLLIRPLPRWAIYVAKLAATLVVTIALTAAFTALTYAVIGWGYPDYWSSGGRTRMFQTIALFALTLTSYDAIFGFLSLLMKRALLLGIGYIILLEGVFANIDFAIRKVTVMYYFRVLCERWMGLADVWEFPGPEKFTYGIDLDTAPSLKTCLITLASISVVLTALAGLSMCTREFRVKTPEGN